MLVYNKKDILILFFIGLLMGPFSSFLFINVFHLPFVVPELIFLPFFFLFSRKYGIKLVRKIHFVGVFLLWLLFLLFALLYDRWNLMAIFSTARSFLLLGLFYSIGLCVKVNKSLISMLLIISIASLIGWVLKSHINFVSMSGVMKESVVYGNMVAIAYSFSIVLLLFSNYLWLSLVIFLNVYLTFTTSLRRQILVSIISLVLSFFLMSIKRMKVSYLILLSVFSFSLVTALPHVENYLSGYNEIMYKRIFQRSENLLDGRLGNSEQQRVDDQLLIFTDFQELFIPHGYVSQQTGTDVGTGIFNDVPIYMLAFTFGVIPTLFYLVYYIRRLYVCLSKYLRKNNQWYGVLFVVSSVVFILHFIEASLFTVSYTAPFTGLTLGLLFRNDNINIQENE